MAVMQTPHGRVVGLIIREDGQPEPRVIEKKPGAEVKAEAKTQTAKRPGRTAKK